MQTLYTVAINQNLQVSVDVFSPKHSGIAKWRTYFAVTPASLQRLRAIYSKHKKAFYIRKEWSPARWKSYKTWYTRWLIKSDCPSGQLSLDSLQTKVTTE